MSRFFHLQTRLDKVLPQCFHLYGASLRNHVLEAMNMNLSLEPSSQHLEPNPSSPVVLSLSGTVPMVYKGTTYHIPVQLFFPPEYPQNPPIVFVRPTAEMIISPRHRNVGPDGRCYHEYITNWSEHSSSLVELINVFSSIFSGAPPCRAKPRDVQLTSDRSQQPSSGGSHAASGSGRLERPGPDASREEKRAYLEKRRADLERRRNQRRERKERREAERASHDGRFTSSPNLHVPTIEQQRARSVSPTARQTSPYQPHSLVDQMRSLNVGKSESSLPIHLAQGNGSHAPPNSAPNFGSAGSSLHAPAQPYNNRRRSLGSHRDAVQNAAAAPLPPQHSSVAPVPVPQASENGSSDTGSGSGREEEPQCVMCLDAKPCFACIPCGHMCVCADCHDPLVGFAKRQNQPIKCPMCRAETTTLIRIFVS